MFHAQIPPPTHADRQDIFGITWVDLVFPFFLFAMGAAIPIAVSNRIEKGSSKTQIFYWLATRALLLASFSLFSEHLRPHEWSANHDQGVWLFSIAGFFLMVLMYGHFPKPFPPKAMRAVQLAAWIIATLCVLTHYYPDGNRGVENGRNDIILLVLANVAFTGGVAWLLTPKAPIVRVVLMAAVGFVFINQSAPDSVAKQIWDFNPLQFFPIHSWTQSRFFPIFYHFEYQKYLMIVLPGTLCGDLILRAMRDEESPAVPAPKFKSIALVFLGMLASAVGCIGLLARATVATFWCEMAICSALLLLSARRNGHVAKLVSDQIRLGSAFLFLGLLAEPMGGGIRKDVTTLSYYLVTAGLAFLALASLEVAIDVLHDKWILKFPWLVGMNPMLAYIAITNLVMGLNGWIGYSARLTSGSLVSQPWILALVDGGVRTLLVGLVACAFTKAKIFLRT
jgi:predicted acyltransferase